MRRQGMRMARVAPVIRQPNPRTRLWQTCAHEAAHFVIARVRGYEDVGWPRILAEDVGTVHAPRPENPTGGMRDLVEREATLVDVLVDLVGPVVTEMLTATHDGCEWDWAAATSKLRHLEAPWNDRTVAYRSAQNEVRKHWGKIVLIADKLAVDFAEKNAPQ